MVWLSRSLDWSVIGLPPRRLGPLPKGLFPAVRKCSSGVDCDPFAQWRPVKQSLPMDRKTGQDEWAAEAESVRSTGMLMMKPPPTAPAQALEVVSAAVEVMSMFPSLSVSPAVPVVEAALPEAEAPPLWQAVLPEAEASVVAEPRPPRVATSVGAETRPFLWALHNC